MKINFYQTSDILHKNIAPILIKILEEKKKALILFKDEELLNQVDSGLWSFSKTKFLPHGKDGDNIKITDQPILLSQKEENDNNSSYLILFHQANDNFIANFEKIFYFFDEENKKESQKLWRYYKNLDAELNFFKKEADKWIKIAI